MQSTHLPASWVESLFGKLAALYGDHAIPAGEGEGGESAMLENCAYCAAPFNSAMLPPPASPPP